MTPDTSLDQPPADRVKRDLAGPVISTDDEELLAGEQRSSAADSCAGGCRDAIDDGIPKRSAADYATNLEANLSDLLDRIIRCSG